MNVNQLKRPRLDSSRMRIRRHRKDAYEYVSGAMTYCLKVGDYESALWLKDHLREVKGDDY